MAKGLVLGVGGRAGSEPGALDTVVAQALAEAGADQSRVGLVATVDRRADDPALRGLVARLGARLAAYSPETLATQQVPHPSDTVAKHLGTPSVAEAAVLAAGAELVLPRITDGRWTVAVGAVTDAVTDQEKP